MDGTTARRIIDEQDREVRQALQHFITELGRQASAIGINLTPWATRTPAEESHPSPPKGNTAAIYATLLAENANRYKPRPITPTDLTKTPGPIDPQLRKLLEGADNWFHMAYANMYQWRNLKNFHGWTSLRIDPNIASHRHIEQAIQPDVRYSPTYLGYKVGDICEGLAIIAKKLQEFQVYEQLLDIPKIIRTPRYSQLKEGFLARLFTEDLEAQIAAGIKIENSLISGEPALRPLQEWEKETRDLLAGLTPPVEHGFSALISGNAACDCPGIANPNILAQAYLSLGLTYLKEVRERMSDYAEASGQVTPEPKISMTVSGGTFYGAQFAAQISNIDTTIAGVLHQGSSDMAAALKALKQAVLSQEGLDEDQSQDLLDNVEYLAEAAQTPPEKRNRGIIKSVLGALTAATTSGVELGKAMDTWGGILHRLLP